MTAAATSEFFVDGPKDNEAESLEDTSVSGYDETGAHTKSNEIFVAR
jgi:hypothetical protein